MSVGFYVSWHFKLSRICTAVVIILREWDGQYMRHAVVNKKCIQNFGQKAWMEAIAEEDLGTEGRVYWIVHLELSLISAWWWIIHFERGPYVEQENISLICNRSGTTQNLWFFRKNF